MVPGARHRPGASPATPSARRVCGPTPVESRDLRQRLRLRALPQGPSPNSDGDHLDRFRIDRNEIPDGHRRTGRVRPSDRPRPSPFVDGDRNRGGPWDRQPQATDGPDAGRRLGAPISLDPPHQRFLSRSNHDPVTDGDPGVIGERDRGGGGSPSFREDRGHRPVGSTIGSERSGPSADLAARDPRNDPGGLARRARVEPKNPVRRRGLTEFAEEARGMKRPRPRAERGSRRFAHRGLRIHGVSVRRGR